MSTGQHLTLMQLGATATYALDAGITKYGSLMCQEAQVCRDSTRLSQEHADDFGLEIVYSGEASLAKPDFTAECLNAQQAGVEIFGVGLDANSLTRLAASCARQGFFPVYASAASIANVQHENDPNIPRLISGSPVAAFPLTSIPAVKQMRDAFDRYAPDVQVFAGHMTGWVSGKLLEEATRAIEEPTTEAILAGLWSIRDNDLGGLTHPLTFAESATAARATCWWPVIIEKGTYEAPYGEAARCKEVL
jgi:branched-chain amino acid transport system substrate-binding protein